MFKKVQDKVQPLLKTPEIGDDIWLYVMQGKNAHVYRGTIQRRTIMNKGEKLVVRYQADKYHAKETFTSMEPEDIYTNQGNARIMWLWERDDKKAHKLLRTVRKNAVDKAKTELEKQQQWLKEFDKSSFIFWEENNVK